MSSKIPEGTIDKRLTLILKRSLIWTGRIFAVAGIIFVVLRYKKYSNEIDFFALSIIDWSVLFSLSIVYAISNILLVVSWRVFLLKFNSEISLFNAIKIYGLTQISKYIPGNIFHLAGRQTMGMAAGISGWALIKSSAWELGLLTVTAMLFVILPVPLLFPEFNIFLAIIIFAAIVIVFGFILYHFFGHYITFVFCLYLLFFIISGLIFLFLLLFFSNVINISGTIWFLIVASYIIAWLAGLVTPGAPAGMGVREVILLLLLGQVFPEDQLLLAAILGRIVTVLGDIIFFSAALFAGKPSASIVN